MESEFDIGAEIKGRAGVLTLNRPRALNALTLGMVTAMAGALDAWALDDRVTSVVVRSTGGRAFCAGGDVKAAALEARETQGAAPVSRAFFRAEYGLNHRIHTFPKPYVALMNGIVMGGGAGISVHGSHRVATPDLLFAMPETGIGFFPDVGGGYFLPRCPGQIGIYLGLTGARIGAGDALYAGLVTHLVAAEAVPRIEAALAQGAAPDVVLAAEALPPPPPPLAEYRGMIDRCFSLSTVAEIAAALKAEGSAFATETLHTMDSKCPTSLAVALEQMRRGAALDFTEVMRMEYRLACAMMARPDFYEGVRAALIDKGQAPRWAPPEARIAQYFQSLGPEDIVLPVK